MNTTHPCNNCGGDDFVEITSEAEIVCRNCGLVQESRLIDERSEWRTFSDKDKESVDPNRVGGPTNHLVEGLTTTIARERGDGGLSNVLNRLHARTNNPDRPLITAIKFIGGLCEKLKLNNKSVQDTACTLYKDCITNKALKGRPMKALAAACLFSACRQGRQPRTFKDIEAVLGNDVSKKEIGRAFKDLQQIKKDELHEAGAAPDALVTTVVQHPAEFVVKFCNALHFDFKLRRVCEDMARNAKPDGKTAVAARWDGRTPTSVASAIVYIIMLIQELRNAAKAPAEGGDDPGNKAKGGAKAPADQALHHVHLVSSVAEATIRVAYRDLYPSIEQLLPPGFATPEEIARLPNPDLKPGAANAGGRATQAATPPPQPAIV